MSALVAGETLLVDRRLEIAATRNALPRALGLVDSVVQTAAAFDIEDTRDSLLPAPLAVCV